MRVFGALLAIIMACALPPRAAAQEACPVHVVADGDTLGDLALTYYGVREEAARIYAANRAAIGPDIDLIEPGQRLTLPCEGGAALIAMPEGAGAPEATAEEAVSGAQDAMEMADEKVMAGEQAAGGDAALMAMATGSETAPADGAERDTMMAMMPRPGLHVLTGGPFAPFAGEALPGGGMIVELLETALAGSGEPDFDLAFVNDRDSHLDLVMPRGGFGLAVPWAYPDCAAELSPAAREMCDMFIASDGFYEFVTEFYARADSTFASIVLPGGLAGTRFCRPIGYPLDDLTDYGLLPERLTLVRAADPAACLRALDAGDVDIASMDAAVTRALIDRIDIENPIVVLENLTEVDRLRVLALRSDPEAEARIARLNAALAEMSGDGRWFEIVSRHLQGPPE
ncbi:MAG: hypothetical protein AAFY59_08300 [Pseudomonadota bacterium]